jgi:toxin ParE1/3/4
MKRVIRRTKQLADDIVDIYVYLAIRSPQSADRLLAAIESSIRSLADNPGVGRRWHSPRPALVGMRVTIVSSYRNYLIFFRPTDDSVDVFRVVHGARELPRIIDLIDLDFNE